MHRLRAPVVGPNALTDIEKAAIAYEIKPITDADAVKDFLRLRGYNHELINLSLVGNKAVDRFLYVERLNTVGKKGVNYYDVYAGRAAFADTGYVQRLLASNKPGSRAAIEAVAWKNIYNLYFGSISIFRPLVAANLYARFTPECVLDPTMGWGGRLVGALACDIPRYIGIDNNPALEQPYADMLALLGPLSKTKATLLFKSALDVDYEKFDYDMVLTSPPYFALELYGGVRASAYPTTEAWCSEFYIPLFKKTYAGLRPGGHYCLNIQHTLYESVCVPLLGPATLTIELSKVQRRGSTYTESIYIWKKPLAPAAPTAVLRLRLPNL
jgi:hypothetical protein